jgi:hypothetical protein
MLAGALLAQGALTWLPTIARSKGLDVTRPLLIPRTLVDALGPLRPEAESTVAYWLAT